MKKKENDAPGTLLKINGTKIDALVKAQTPAGVADVDHITDLNGMTPMLLNPRLASEVDLCACDLGTMINIPVQVSDKRGGRKSVLFLNPGERVLTSVLCSSDGLAYVYFNRDTGSTVPSEPGSEYTVEIRGANGELIAKMQGKLESVEAGHSTAKFAFQSGRSESEREEGGTTKAIGGNPRAATYNCVVECSWFSIKETWYCWEV